MAIHLLIPGYPGKSLTKGHTGETELYSFILNPHDGKAKGGDDPLNVFVVSMDTSLNDGLIRRLVLAQATETSLPNVFVFLDSHRYMFWGVTLTKHTPILMRDDTTVIYFGFQGTSLTLISQSK